MNVYAKIQTCSVLALLLATLVPAAPVTSSVPYPTTAPPAEGEEELGSGGSTPASTSSPNYEESGLAEPQSTEIEAIVTTESPHGSYDCTATSNAAQAHATASFRRGSSLIIENLGDHLRVRAVRYYCALH